MMKNSMDKQPPDLGNTGPRHRLGHRFRIPFPDDKPQRSQHQLDGLRGARLIMPLSFLVTFYVNYFLLVPHYLFKREDKTLPRLQPRAHRPGGGGRAHLAGNTCTASSSASSRKAGPSARPSGCSSCATPARWRSLPA